MRNLLFIGAAAAALVAAAPASAQVYMGGDPGGVGVRAGPFAFGAGPGYRDPYAYGSYGNGARGYIGSRQYGGWDDSAFYGSYGYAGPYSYGGTSFGYADPNTANA